MLGRTLIPSYKLLDRLRIVILMVTLDEVRARVAASYADLGLPSWPSPRPEMVMPREEEYSRVTNPERYEIVPARARVWAEQLAALPGVTTEQLSPGPLNEDGHLGWFDRGIRLVSSRPDTVPLLLLEYEVDGQAGLHISLVRPEILIRMVPDCGCDACDSGSADLLGEIDDSIAAVVGGPYVLLRGADWSAQWHPDGSETIGTVHGADFDQLMNLCRSLSHGENVQLPPDAKAFVGHSWLN